MNNDLNDTEELNAKQSINNENVNQNNSFENNKKPNNLLGLTESGYTVLMHLSQFAGIIIPLLGFAAPIVLWLINRDNKTVDIHGKNIANFLISILIYSAISTVLCIILVGFVLLAIITILEIVFAIIAAVKASNDESWKYPLSITFFA